MIQWSAIARGSTRSRFAFAPPSYFGKCPCREHCCQYQLQQFTSRNLNKVTPTTHQRLGLCCRQFRRENSSRLIQLIKN
jgi:hypothetical protein